MRRVLFFVVLFVVAIVSYSFLIEPYSLSITTLDLNQGKNMRIVFFADLHMRSYGWYHDILLSRLDKLEPDYILFGGDVGKPGVSHEDLQRFFTRLSCIAPVYSVLGNWDYNIRTKLEAIYEESGVTLLDGGKALLGDEARLVELVGMPLNRRYWVDDDQQAVIVMQHYAHASARYSGPTPIIFLSGHTHGTQFYLPFISEWIFSERLGYVKGLYEMNGESLMYVTNGIGAWFNFRFLAPPEIVLIML